MEEVRKIDYPAGKDALKPCDYFDLIVGTSTGGYEPDPIVEG
jgi:patatin-like phospholipase/acyl hydrolase